jgi:hypothetical protein
LRGREIAETDAKTLPCKRGREGPAPRAWEGGGLGRPADMDIAIELLTGPTTDARELIAELDEVLGAANVPQPRHGL